MPAFWAIEQIDYACGSVRKGAKPRLGLCHGQPNAADGWPGQGRRAKRALTRTDGGGPSSTKQCRGRNGRAAYLFESNRILRHTASAKRSGAVSPLKERNAHDHAATENRPPSGVAARTRGRADRGTDQTRERAAEGAVGMKKAPKGAFSVHAARGGSLATRRHAVRKWR